MLKPNAIITAAGFVRQVEWAEGDSAAAKICRQFEETQGRLEAAVEQCSLPLALVPQIEVCTVSSYLFAARA